MDTPHGTPIGTPRAPPPDSPVRANQPLSQTGTPNPRGDISRGVHRIINIGGSRSSSSSSSSGGGGGGGNSHSYNNSGSSGSGRAVPLTPTGRGGRERDDMVPSTPGKFAVATTYS